MINDAKLQKLILGPDWIDLSFGEPKVVMDALYHQLKRKDIGPLDMPKLKDMLKWEYQPAAGRPDLVKVLEKKYDTKVVICNGAKQALAASMYAFKMSGIKDIYYDRPFYPANPSLVELVGLSESNQELGSSFLITSPNNPDGKNLSNIELLEWRHRGPMIHDAAYYTEVYIPEGQMPIPVGNIQVFSMSKMYGLSGLRIGYAVCHSEKYYQDVVNYMELTTAGVSTASQDIACNIEMFFRDNPTCYDAFIAEARASIASAREALKGLDPEVLELMPCQSNSMFAWFKKGPRLDNRSAKVHILDGTLFGAPGMMRMNIAHPVKVIAEAVKRLNKHKI